MTNQAGQCPICNSQDLQYGAIELEGDMLYYPYECRNCKQKGEEWYNITFAGHSIATENGMTII